jgi:hypothetical protein
MSMILVLIGRKSLCYFSLYLLSVVVLSEPRVHLDAQVSV